MLRTSLRKPVVGLDQGDPGFLSSNAQDFIEDPHSRMPKSWTNKFLSSNAQDFIEDWI